MKKQAGITIGALTGAGIIVLLIFLLAFGKNNEQKITRFINSNQANLEEIAMNCLNGNETTDTYKGVVVEGVYPGEHRIVQFYFDGTGLVPSTTYYGFYYSEDAVPVAFQNINIELVSTADNQWVWDDGTDNGGLTKKIAENWFYYKAWF